MIESLNVLFFLLILILTPSGDSTTPQLLPIAFLYLLLLVLVRFSKVFILIFFALAIYFFGWNQISSYQSIKACLAVFLYLLAFFVSEQKKEEILFLLPYFFPFLYVSLLIDLFPPPLMALFSLAMIVFLPPLIVYSWKCKPLNHPGLDRLAEKMHFSHAGFRTWDLGLAAIIGMIPKFRYVLLSRDLVNFLPEDALEAVVAHEIGHSHHSHLFWAPFILSGSFFPLFFVDNFTFPFYLVFVLLYFRYVFGFYSRLFERQADLHGITCGLPLSAMTKALDQVGIFSGHTHRIPSWHHFSLYERIEFLKQVEADPFLAKAHHQKVHFWKWTYLIIFILVGVWLL